MIYHHFVLLFISRFNFYFPSLFSRSLFFSLSGFLLLLCFLLVPGFALSILFSISFSLILPMPPFASALTIHVYISYFTFIISAFPWFSLPLRFCRFFIVILFYTTFISLSLFHFDIHLSFLFIVHIEALFHFPALSADFIYIFFSTALIFTSFIYHAMLYLFSPTLNFNLFSFYVLY